MVRWLFADQLGPHYADDEPIVLIESRSVFQRRTFHRQKAHLVLSGMRHRAAEAGGHYLRSQTYAEALSELAKPVTVINPTSFAARAFVAEHEGVEVLPSRGFATSAEFFSDWAQGRKRFVLEDWYRHVRKSKDILMDGDQPVGGVWNLDDQNRLPPPKGVTRLDVRPAWTPTEDEIDEGVRADLDAWERSGDVKFLGDDGPRWFAVTRAEALAALEDFLDFRLADFGPYEDAMLAADPVLAHSMLSVPMNLGLLDPMEVVAAAVQRYDAGEVPLNSVEGFTRQILGWREYVWHLYWHFGPEYGQMNALRAQRALPTWFAELDAESVQAACLSNSLDLVRKRGWTHHIVRLMVLGNWALQQGYQPGQVTDWFSRAFVDGYDWVMAANVMGMALHADGGMVASKPYAAGGAYINRMSNFCSGCAYRPSLRTGESACPFTAGYWWFLDRNADALAKNHRMGQALAGRKRLADLDQLVAEQSSRGDGAP
jgi:deoxyribodipyrimidine photolyase-related protein